jgi:hypothetical protein
MIEEEDWPADIAGASARNPDTIARIASRTTFPLCSDELSNILAAPLGREAAWSREEDQQVGANYLTLLQSVNKRSFSASSSN